MEHDKWKVYVSSSHESDHTTVIEQLPGPPLNGGARGAGGTVRRRINSGDTTCNSQEEEDSPQKLADALRCMRTECRNLSPPCKLYFLSKENGDHPVQHIFRCVGVYCSINCANKEKNSRQHIIAVNLLQDSSKCPRHVACNPEKTCEEKTVKKCSVLEENAVRECGVCLEDTIYIPFAVCSECNAYMCAECYNSSKKLNQSWKCGNNCGSTHRLVMPPDFLHSAANMKELVFFEEVSLHEEDPQQRAQYLQALQQREAHRQRVAHQQHVLEREVRMLHEQNALQDLASGCADEEMQVEESDFPRELSASGFSPDFSHLYNITQSSLGASFFRVFPVDSFDSKPVDDQICTSNTTEIMQQYLNDDQSNHVTARDPPASSNFEVENGMEDGSGVDDLGVPNGNFPAFP